MRRFFKKFLPVLLLPVLLLPACAQEYNHDLSEPTDSTVQSFPACPHIFTTTVVNEFRYISETQHSCYEVEITACVTCHYMVKEDLSLLYTEGHEILKIDDRGEDENGEYIYYGTCEHCNGYGKTTP